MSEPFNRERDVGQGCPLAPLLFALAIEPVSRMLKQTMSGMHIDSTHVRQDTTVQLWQRVQMTPPSLLVDLTTLHMQRKPSNVTWMHHQHPSTGTRPRRFCVAAWHKTHHHQMSFTLHFEITTGNLLQSKGVIALCESLKTNIQCFVKPFSLFCK